jgi:hypothetical protein
VVSEVLCGRGFRRHEVGITRAMSDGADAAVQNDIHPGVSVLWLARVGLDATRNRLLAKLDLKGRAQFKCSTIERLPRLRSAAGGPAHLVRALGLCRLAHAHPLTPQAIQQSGRHNPQVGIIGVLWSRPRDPWRVRRLFVVDMSPCRLPCQRAHGKTQRRKGIVGADVGDTAQENVSTTGRNGQRSDVVDASRSLQRVEYLSSLCT